MERRLAQGILALAAVACAAFAWRCDTAWFDRHVFLPQQFFIAASRGIPVGSRILAAVLAVAFSVGAARIRGGASARRALVAILLAIPAAEGLLRWRMPRLGNPDVVLAMDGLVARSARYGSSLAPAMDRVQRVSGRDIRIRTDADGHRFSGRAMDAASPSLVFTGESTVAGLGLQWDETFAAVLGARLHLQIVNLGSPAYRLDQSWLRLKDALPKLDHPAAVVGLFVPGLVGRAFAGQRHPVARPSPSGGVNLMTPPAPTLLERSALARLWRHLYWSDADLEEGMRSTAAVLRTMAALANARGIPCIFIVTGKTPPWMLRELFEAQGLDAVVAEVPEDELLADGHPGPHGALRIADALEARLRAKTANR